MAAHAVLTACNWEIKRSCGGFSLLLLFAIKVTVSRNPPSFHKDKKSSYSMALKGKSNYLPLGKGKYIIIKILKSQMIRTGWQ